MQARLTKPRKMHKRNASFGFPSIRSVPPSLLDVGASISLVFTLTTRQHATELSWSEQLNLLLLNTRVDTYGGQVSLGPFASGRKRNSPAIINRLINAIPQAFKPRILLP